MQIAEKWFRLAARIVVRQVRIYVEEYRQDLAFAILRLQLQNRNLEEWFQLPLPGAERDYFELVWADHP